MKRWPLISALLAFSMMLTMLPADVFAAEEDAGELVNAQKEQIELRNSTSESDTFPLSEDDPEILMEQDEPDETGEIVGLAEDAGGTCGTDLTWTVSGTTLTISGDGVMSNYSSGSAPWYGYRDAIARLVIGDGMTNIGSYAFYGLANLGRVTFGSGITSIGDYAFCYYNYNSAVSQQCRSLTSITIPDSVTSIGTYAFAGSGLVTVNIGDGVTSIGTSAFQSCAGLMELNLGSGLTNIGNYAFRYCTSLSTVVIPDNVTSIGDYAFSGCSILAEVTLGENATRIGSYAFQNCSILKTVYLNEYLSTVESYAFQNCPQIADVYYAGTEDDWSYVTVKTGNADLTNATFHYDVVQEISVTGVTLNKSALSLTEGGSETLTATVAPSNATDKGVMWSSSNNDVQCDRHAFRRRIDHPALRHLSYGSDRYHGRR